MVKIKGSKDRTPFALKILKKSEIVRLRQVGATSVVIEGGAKVNML